jgi:hypothetical protein
MTFDSFSVGLFVDIRRSWLEPERRRRADVVDKIWSSCAPHRAAVASRGRVLKHPVAALTLRRPEERCKKARMLDTLTTVGSLVGLITGAFVLFDRLWRGRPIACVQTEPNTGGKIKGIRIRNAAQVDILIREIRVKPPFVRVARSSEIYDLASALIKGEMVAVLGPSHARFFPLMGHGIPLEDAPPQRIWFRISWRRTDSTWLWQFPKWVSTSTDDLRRIAEAADN